MFKDKLLSDDEIAVTSAEVYSDVIDQGAAGDAYVGAWLKAIVHTAFTTGGTSLTVKLQTAVAENFASPIDLVVGPAVIVAELIAGKDLLKVRMPVGSKRYLRFALTNSGTLVAGTVDCMIVADENLRVG
jgi:hypothetical protein